MRNVFSFLILAVLFSANARATEPNLENHPAVLKAYEGADVCFMNALEEIFGFSLEIGMHTGIMQPLPRDPKNAPQDADQYYHLEVL